MTEKEEFISWMREVDRILYTSCGMTHSCLADVPYYDHFTSGTDPKAMAAITLVDYNDFPLEDLPEELADAY